MLTFQNFIFSEEIQDIRVKGPGITKLAHIAVQMVHRGAPVEKNDYGFNGQHYLNVLNLTGGADFNHPEGMPLSMAIYLLRTLAVYKKTQLPSLGINYEQLTKEVYDDVNRAKTTAGIKTPQIQPQAQGENKAIVFPNDVEFNKVKIQLPQVLDRSMVMAINKMVKDHLGDKLEYAVDNYGKKSPVLYKHFSKDRTDAKSIRIHKTLLNNVIDILKAKGIDVVTADGKTFIPNQEQQKLQEQKNKIKVLGVEDAYGKLKIVANIPYESGFRYADAKNAGLAPGIIGLQKDFKGGAGNLYQGWVYLIDVLDARKAINLFAEKNLDYLDIAQKLAELANEMETKGKSAASKEISIGFRDINPKSNELAIRVPFMKLDAKTKQLLKDTVKYLFPEFTWHGDPDWEYRVKGDFTQYIQFGQILKKPPYNFDANGETIRTLREIVKNKIKNGGLDSSHVEGKVPKGFEDEIERRLPQSKFDLYEAQKEGIAFLYGRKHAILGDETGLGKTVQLISAAALKLQEQPNKGCLVIGLKGIQNQWIESIKDVIGDNAQISTDPLHPAQWTILYYENFASKGTKEGEEGKKSSEWEANIESYRTAAIKSGIAKGNSRGTYYVGNVPLNSLTKKQLKLLLPDAPKLMETLAKYPFEIVIFDELHKVKHDTTKRWKNIEAITEKIPIKWGASATVSSNKPLDVRNQLKILGHYLGDINVGRFKRDFAGMQPRGYRGAYVEGDLEDRIVAAEKLNRWLNMTGLYVRRSKGDVRDMPNLEVKENDVEGLSQADFHKMYSDKVKDYADPELAISQLIAARNVIAIQKTDPTTRKVYNIVRSGEGKSPAAGKTVVFTNFVDAGKQLYAKISDAIKDINPKYHVLTYTSDTSKSARSQVKQRFTDDPNAKVLVMSMKMGGTGIDFPNAAQNMVINDFDWTPEAAEQSEGRIYRINTNHPVFITYMVAEGMDKDLYDKVREKRIVASVIQKHRKIYQETGSEEELNKLVDVQKKNEKLNQDIEKIITAAMGSKKNESFEEFFNRTYILL